MPKESQKSTSTTKTEDDKGAGLDVSPVIARRCRRGAISAEVCTEDDAANYVKKVFRFYLFKIRQDIMHRIANIHSLKSRKAGNAQGIERK